MPSWCPRQLREAPAWSLELRNFTSRRQQDLFFLATSPRVPCSLLPQFCFFLILNRSGSDLPLLVSATYTETTLVFEGQAKCLIFDIDKIFIAKLLSSCLNKPHEATLSLDFRLSTSTRSRNFDRRCGISAVRFIAHVLLTRSSSSCLPFRRW